MLKNILYLCKADYLTQILLKNKTILYKEEDEYHNSYYHAYYYQYIPEYIYLFYFGLFMFASKYGCLFNSCVFSVR